MVNECVKQLREEITKLLNEPVSSSNTTGKVITNMLVEGLIDYDDANRMLLDESMNLQEANEIKKILEICRERENDEEYPAEEVHKTIREKYFGS